MMLAMPALREEPSAPPLPRAERVGQLVREHFSFVWRCLRRLGVREGDADDAAQQVFLVASRRIADIRAGSERAFLFRTAANVARTVHRTEVRRREDPEDELEGREDDAPPPDELVDRRRARELFDSILDQMHDELRTVLVLFEVEGFTTEEMSRALGIPQGTAASRLRRARADFEARVMRIEARWNRGVSR